MFQVLVSNNGKMCNKVCQCLVNNHESTKHYNGLSCTNIGCYQDRPCRINGHLQGIGQHCFIHLSH